MAEVLLIDPALAMLRDRIAKHLPAGVDVAVVADFSDEELRRLAIDATVLVNARRVVDTRTLALAPAARFIQVIGVGIDTIDRAAVAAAGITVAYNPGVNRTGVAEHAIMLMLALLKRLHTSERATRAGRFDPAEIIPGGLGDLADVTVGLVGMGHIGLSVAERLVPFGSTIVYHARHAVPDADRLGARLLSLSDLLAASDIVSLHVPLTPETHHLIGARELAAMPAGSYLINTGRGELVDEAALRDAIVGGHLAGAGLDVIHREPDGVNPFADLPDVIVTPHVGGGSRNSLAAVVERSAANIGRFLASEPVHDAIIVKA